MIAAIEPIAVALPLRAPMKMSGVEVRTADNVIVRLSTDSEAVGWGEAASAPNMTGETVPGMVAAIRYLVPFLRGFALDDFERIHAEMEWRMVGNHAAKAAIEVALHDALARTRGVSVATLLGATVRSRIPILWLLGTGSEDADVREASAKRAEGFVAYKIKVGADPVAADARRTASICEALGAGVLISADANQAWPVDAALEYVRGVQRTRLDFLEQPCRAADLAGMARVAAATSIAIGTDEGIHSSADIRAHHAAGAARGASIKTIKLGGVRPALEAARLCDALGMKVNLACKIAESSIGTAAILHLAAVVPGIDWGVSLSAQYLADDLVHAPIPVVGGYASVPSGPGLGVDVDPDKIERYRVT